MSAEAKKKTSLKWPICTIIIIGAISALAYWGYTEFQAERAMTAPAISAPKAPGAASGQTAAPQAYRGGLPFYLIAGFAGVMTVILGGILYLWWSLKDWEGGKKYGEEETGGED